MSAHQLEEKIAQHSLTISRRMEKATVRELSYISGALSLLAQAQLMVESNPSLARLLVTRADRLGNLRDTKG